MHHQSSEQQSSGGQRGSGLTLALAFALVFIPSSSAHAFGGAHLLLTEAALTPPAGEYIEIVNPTAAAIDLTNYYLADSTAYWRVPSGGVLPSPGDFVARFPAGSSIGPGQVITISTTAQANGFFSTYGFEPDYMLPPAVGPDASSRQPPPVMTEAFMGSISNGHNLVDSGEGVHLFFWNGQSDLVLDVDVVRFGSPTINNDIINKTGANVDGPDKDTTPSAYAPDSMTMPVMGPAAGSGFSHKRIAHEAGHEVEGNGNGITGHDETTEDISITFDGGDVPYSAPDPGLWPLLGTCPADIHPPPDGNGSVNVQDLLAVIASWGACSGCDADINGDGTVNVTDLLTVIGDWGPCG